MLQLRNWGIEWLSNLPKVTQLVNDRARIQTQAVWLQSLCFWPQHHAFPLHIWIQLCLQQSGPLTPTSQECRPWLLFHRPMGMGPEAAVVQVPLWKNKSLCVMVLPDIEEILRADSICIELKIKMPPSHEIYVRKWNQIQIWQMICWVVTVGISNYFIILYPLLLMPQGCI